MLYSKSTKTIKKTPGRNKTPSRRDSERDRSVTSNRSTKSTRPKTPKRTTSARPKTSKDDKLKRMKLYDKERTSRDKELTSRSKDRDKYPSSRKESVSRISDTPKSTYKKKIEYEYTNKLSESQIKLKSKDKIIIRLETAVDTYKEEIIALKNALDSTTDELKDKKIAYIKIKEENKKWKEDYKKNKKDSNDNQQYLDEIKRLKDENKKLKKDLHDAENKLKDNTIMEANENERESLQIENQFLKDNNAQLEKKVASLNKESKQLRTHIQSFEIKMNDFKHSNENLQIEIEMMKKNKIQKDKYIAILLKEKNKIEDSQRNNHEHTENVDRKQSKEHELIQSNHKRKNSDKLQLNDLKIDHLERSSNKSPYKDVDSKKIVDYSPMMRSPALKDSSIRYEQQYPNKKASPMIKSKKENDTIRKSYEEFKSLKDLNNENAFKTRVKEMLSSDKMGEKYKKYWDNLHK